MTQGLDIIGDVHGHATELRTLLDRLGYQLTDGAYRHPERRAVFVGDLVDRGPDQRAVLELVKAMVDGDSADIVMGNHEFNAIAYATPDPDNPNDFVRVHSDKNRGQHAEFLDQIDDPAERQSWVDWFKTIPLWLDTGDVRVIHACWHEPSIRVVQEHCGGNRLTDAAIVAAATKGTDLYWAVEVLLKGPEIDLTKYGERPYLDWGNVSRTLARIRWWDSAATTLRDLADMRVNKSEDGGPYGELPAREVDPGDGPDFVYTDRIPLFYGHYWLEWKNRQQDCTTYTACVDFSGSREGPPLVAYRWSGEPTMSPDNYVTHERAAVGERASR